MSCHRVAGAIIILATSLAGCSSMPPFDAPESRNGPPTVSDVIAKIECEVAQARYAPENNNPEFLAYLHNTLNLADFSQWAASVTLSLTVNDTEGLTPTGGLTLTYLDPLSIPGTTFAFGASPQLYQTRQRIFTQTYTLDMTSLPTNACEKFEGKFPKINLAGDLGLRDQIYMGLHAFRRDDASDYSTGDTTNPASIGGIPDNFGATASFDVFKGLTNVGPTWTLTRFMGPVGGLGYQRDDLDKMAITFVPVAYGKPTHSTSAQAHALFATQYQTRAAAVGAAQRANQQLVTTQAIQELGQILSTRIH
jgi:hypothetical protein